MDWSIEYLLSFFIMCARHWSFLIIMVLMSLVSLFILLRISLFVILAAQGIFNILLCIHISNTSYFFAMASFRVQDFTLHKEHITFYMPHFCFKREVVTLEYCPHFVKCFLAFPMQHFISWVLSYLSFIKVSS